LKTNGNYQNPVPLDKNHDAAEFDCGEIALNDYLRKYAYANNMSGAGMTYVSCKENKVVGFYTIAPGGVCNPMEVSERITKGMPKGRDIPVFVLGRLAVDKKYQGQGLGKSLLRDALLNIATGAKKYAGRAVIVHAKNEKVKQFYTAIGFEESRLDPLHLAILINDIKKWASEQ
jgi:GNAT superfamily N-acetyltransferase